MPNNSFILRNRGFFPLLLITVVIVVCACANRGQGPTGGKKDEIPPRVVKETPLSGSVNVSKKNIEVIFDENISLEKMAENVIISPPQRRQPAINAYGRVLSVVFNEDFAENTTYSIDFGSAIVDLNEKNPLENYVFSFATGPDIDTLKVSGIVIDAENLNPLQGIIVGIYNEMNDSVFSQKPFLRIGRSNAEGNFSINNMKSDDYKIFALGDVSNDFYHQPGEGLALYDSIVTPVFKRELMRDTLWKDSLTVDTVIERMYTRFLPDNIILHYFRENKTRQYFMKSERRQENMFTLFFGTKADSLPTLKPIGFEWDDNNYILQRNNTLDTLSYWITDSLVWKSDTLQFEMSYQKTDSIYQLIPATDTINVIMRRTRTSARDRERKTDKIPPLNISTNLSSTVEIYAIAQVRSDEPLQSIDASKIVLNEKADTLLVPKPFTLVPADSSKMRFLVYYQFEPEKQYELNIDSAAFVSIYGKVNNKTSNKFKVRSLEEYSNLTIQLDPFQPKAVIQLLTTKDVVLESKPAETNGTLFQYIKPGDYYVRLFIDENENGKWDTGELASRRHPEQVFYYPKKLTLMANWDFEEIWDITETPLLKQKAKELKDASKSRSR